MVLETSLAGGIGKYEIPGNLEVLISVESETPYFEKKGCKFCS